MPRFRKKPVEIEARQHASATDYDKAEALREWIGPNAKWLHSPIGIVFEIHTREGVMRALPNDWIIKGVQGEFYPCKPDIFAATYEPVGAQTDGREEQTTRCGMNRHEDLMIRAMEECNELSQRISKALLFGMEQIQKDADDKPDENPRGLTNKERIYDEYYDLRAVLGMCGIDAWTMQPEAMVAEAYKVRKVERYLERSKACGTLVEEPVTEYPDGNLGITPPQG